MIRFSHWIIVMLMAVLSTPAFTQEVNTIIDPSVSDENEKILLAIKKALVDEAQNSQSEVLSLSWLDPEGRLFDSTMIRSNVEVRGIQIKRYLDEINRPEFQVELDSLGGSLPQCSRSDNKFKRTVNVNVVNKQNDFDVDQKSLGQDIAEFGYDEITRRLDNSPNWGVQSVSLNVAADTYTQVVSGSQIPKSQYILHVSTALGRAPEMHRRAKIPKSDPFSVYWNGQPSVADEFWVRLQMELVSTSGLALTWTGLSDFRVPYRPVSYSKAILPMPVKNFIQQKIQIWTKQLDDFAACEPISFDLVANQKNSFKVSGGTASGVSKGDRLLVLDKRKIPDRVLEPGALSDLSLVEVTSVAQDFAVVEHVAGAKLGVSMNKVAMPF